MTGFQTNAPKKIVRSISGRATTIGRAKVHEAMGERIRSFELQSKDGEQWKTFYTGITVGPDFQTSQFKPVTAQFIRLNILQASQGPTVSEFQLFSKP